MNVSFFDFYFLKQNKYLHIWRASYILHQHVEAEARLLKYNYTYYQ